MEKFPHLNFSEKLKGTARIHGGGGTATRTKENKRNRKTHSKALSNRVSFISKDWEQHIQKREKEGLAFLDTDIQPIFLEINPSIVKLVDFNLIDLGIEVISEEEDGLIIGASLDKLQSLKEKIEGFANETYRTGQIADLWGIIVGNREDWKPRHILSPELYNKWSHIQEDSIYDLQVSIAFDFPIKEEPDRNKRGGEKRYQKYLNSLIERDHKRLERENHFENFINHYKAELKSGYIEFDDSFGCAISINGKGLKDLVVNYPFVFEVLETEPVGGVLGEEETSVECAFEIIPPEKDAPEVGVIDSGIMENHKYISPAIRPKNSISYVKNDSSTADKVARGGHGTKVAGAILYPNSISHLSDSYQLPFFIRNIRILDNDNKAADFTPSLMTQIVDDNPDIRLFNLSVNSYAPFRTKHMSLWAATLDKLIHEHNILFINSAGNIDENSIRHYIKTGNPYPSYLEEAYCRLANPAQSSFAISVGSINHLSLDDKDWESIGKEDEIAPYSRIGNGIWGHIKPDLVEYGGGMKISKNNIQQITTKDTAIELIRSTLDGGSAYNSESVGTSFATPKVTAIAAALLKLYPDEDINLIRALLVQGARLPGDFFRNPTVLAMRHYGYGIPSLERVTTNTEHRITFYNTNQIKAEEGQVYSLKLPDNLRNPGDEFEILIEVSLAYTAKIRRTRQRIKSYLGTWLDWKSSKLDDTYDSFVQSALKELDGEKIEHENKDAENNIRWKIRERKNWGVVKGIQRNDSTLQKSWVILKSHELPEYLYFSVNAHKGWDKSFEPVPYALVVSIEILGQNTPIYNEIKLENEVEVET